MAQQRLAVVAVGSGVEPSSWVQDEPGTGAWKLQLRPPCVHSPTGKRVPLMGSLHPLMTASWQRGGCFPKFLPPVWVVVRKAPSDHSEAPCMLSRQEKAIPRFLCSNAAGLGSDVPECLKMGWYVTASHSTSGSDPPITEGE